MSLDKQWDDELNHSTDFNADFVNEKEDHESDKHRRKIRKCIEERLETKRLRDEIDELDGDFDWDEIDH